MIDGFENGSNIPQQIALFPQDRQPPRELQDKGIDGLKVKLDQLTLHRPRQWGACWLVLQLWKLLDMNAFWEPKLPPSRQGTLWLELLQVHLCNRMIDPGAEWYIHRHWYRQTALANLLGLEPEAIPKNALCAHVVAAKVTTYCARTRRTATLQKTSGGSTYH